MASATFRFHDALNDFLARAWRGADFTTSCARDATVKHMTEALGVPHTEVALVLVNGASSSLERILEEGDRVAVYPGLSQFDVDSLARLPQMPPGRLRFVADAHLGGLARLLRMAGFDTIYSNTPGRRRDRDACHGGRTDRADPRPRVCIGKARTGNAWLACWTPSWRTTADVHSLRGQRAPVGSSSLFDR